MEIFALLRTLLGLGPTIAAITKSIADTKIAMAQAATDQEKTHAEERMTALQAQRDVLIAESAHSPWPMRLQVAGAIGPIMYVSKILIWDKCLKLGSTDPADPHVWYIIGVVYGFLFLHTVVFGGIKIAKS